VTILESATELNEIGAGIQVPPKSSKILISYGLKDKLLEKVIWPRRMQFRRYATGDIVGFAEFHLTMSETYGFP
jgi:salicylate hydroxylase